MSFYFSDSRRKQQSDTGVSLLLLAVAVAVASFLCFVAAFQLGRAEATHDRTLSITPGCATPFPPPPRAARAAYR